MGTLSVLPLLTPLAGTPQELVAVLLQHIRRLPFAMVFRPGPCVQCMAGGWSASRVPVQDLVVARKPARKPADNNQPQPASETDDKASTAAISQPAAAKEEAAPIAPAAPEALAIPAASQVASISPLSPEDHGWPLLKEWQGSQDAREVEVMIRTAGCHIQMRDVLSFVCKICGKQPVL